MCNYLPYVDIVLRQHYTPVSLTDFFVLNDYSFVSLKPRMITVYKTNTVLKKVIFSDNYEPCVDKFLELQMNHVYPMGEFGDVFFSESLLIRIVNRGQTYVRFSFDNKRQFLKNTTGVTRNGPLGLTFYITSVYCEWLYQHFDLAKINAKFVIIICVTIFICIFVTHVLCTKTYLRLYTFTRRQAPFGLWMGIKSQRNHAILGN